MGLGDQKHMRSIAKTALEVLALSEPEMARGELFGAVRRFISNGDDGDDYVRWWFKVAPALPFTADELGEFSHSVIVWGHRGASVVGHVQLFGHVPLLVRLCHEWMGESFAVAHAVDPLGERSFGLRVPDSFPAALEASVFDPEILDLDLVERHYTNFVRKAATVQKDRHLKWVIKEALTPFFAKYAGTEMTEAKAAEVASTVIYAMRFRN
jgi:hypothetical protein